LAPHISDPREKRFWLMELPFYIHRKRQGNA